MPISYSYKKALTLIELIFVIIIIGILSAVLAPRFNRPTLTEATHQLISHIRYTQHLAMVDDKFDPREEFWYRGRWQIFFAKTKGSDEEWAYTIFADKRGTKGFTGFPDVKEIAKNPQNSTTQYLTGGYTWGNIPYKNKITKEIDKRVTKSMNLGHHYGIKKVEFKGGCRARGLRISFDNIGRPLYANSKYLTSQYKANNKNRLIKQTCQILLCLDDPCINDTKRSQTIIIEPETGYAHTL
jgi:prepilin-type N-terminal cleavage/methylation domain-containing protein